MPSSTRRRPNALWTATVLSLARLSAAAYTWPNPQYEALESMFYEGAGVGGSFFSAFVTGCPPRDNTKTTVAAEWVRLAYHDSATFNITDGTGGLDASIYYELERDENIGAGMTRTTSELSTASNKYVSRADVIAMAAIWSIAACKGPILPFRGGRLDASRAGRKGVPEPQQELKDHVESFRLQGFNATEMISLVACGHTLGGVREEDFPTIVPTSGKATRRLDTFDSTDEFDNTVATEYIAGRTKNPLVVNSNQTVASDLRIFSSDQNVTMKSFKDPNTFADTCKTLLTRMLDTVPTGVTLTETIQPIPYKLVSQRFLFIGGELAFTTKFRILETFTINGNQTSVKKRTVRLLWCDKRGANADCADGTANAATAVPSDPFNDQALPPDDSFGAASFFAGSPVAQRMTLAMTYYGVAVSTTFERSVGKFWFVVDEGTSNTTVVDNGGKGYVAVDDEIVYLPVGFRNGQASGTSITDFLQSPFPFYIAAGVHNSTKPSSVRINAYDNSFVVLATNEDTDIGNPRDVLNQTFTLSRNTSLPSLDGYDFYYTEVVNGAGPRVLTADFEADLSDASTGTKKTVAVDFLEMARPEAVPLAPPPLSTISKVSLSSVGGNGTSTTPGSGSGSGSGASALPAIGSMFYAFVGLLSCFIYMA